MSITIRECPHCYMRVGFNDDGVCPSCSRQLRDPGADPSRTVVILTEAMPVSPICFTCGRQTTRRISVSQGSRSSGWRILRVIGSVLIYCVALVFHSFLRLLDNRDDLKHPYQRVRVFIPLCGACQRTHGIPSPHQVDFEKGSISFVVSRDVAARL
jgi:hypothetical protein